MWHLFRELLLRKSTYVKTDIELILELAGKCSLDEQYLPLQSLITLASRLISKPFIAEVGVCVMGSLLHFSSISQLHHLPKTAQRV